MLRSNLNRFFIASFCFVFLFVTQPAYAEQVVVYSARIEQLIKPMFDAFTKETGIEVKYTTDNEGALLARLKAEGR
ncbi:MAG: Fe(3+) ABC transporter substrate-binding protein, partial [Betaproteobacteria bacterium]|nr:Fe(3+) ABC transporter substrate-binding protein [Betaproteobacteria bacterium]